MRFKPSKKELSTGIATALLALCSSLAFAQDNNEAEGEDDADSVELDTVVVVGGRVEQNLEDIAGSVSVMTEKDIEEQMVTMKIA